MFQSAICRRQIWVKNAGHSRGWLDRSYGWTEKGKSSPKSKSAVILRFVHCLFQVFGKDRISTWPPCCVKCSFGSWFEPGFFGTWCTHWCCYGFAVTSQVLCQRIAKVGEVIWTHMKPQHVEGRVLPNPMNFPRFQVTRWHEVLSPTASAELKSLTLGGGTKPFLLNDFWCVYMVLKSSRWLSSLLQVRYVS